jgi:hypothetical protein
MHRQRLESAAELAALLASVAAGPMVLALDVEEQVGALHDALAHGALPVGPLETHHLVLDL